MPRWFWFQCTLNTDIHTPSFAIVCNFLKLKFPASDETLSFFSALSCVHRQSERKKGTRASFCWCMLSGALSRHVEVNIQSLLTLPNFRFAFTHLLHILLFLFFRLLLDLDVCSLGKAAKLEREYEQTTDVNSAVHSRRVYIPFPLTLGSFPRILLCGACVHTHIRIIWYWSMMRTLFKTYSHRFNTKMRAENFFYDAAPSLHSMKRAMEWASKGSKKLWRNKSEALDVRFYQKCFIVN